MSRKLEIKAKDAQEAIDFAIKIGRVLVNDQRYDIEAYSFAMASLRHTMSKLEEKRHLSGREYLYGMRDFALRQFGPMARTVLEHWGIKNTDDVGEIVFNMVEVGLMQKRPEDTKEEFSNVFDFKIAFDFPYQRSVSPKIHRQKN